MTGGGAVGGRGVLVGVALAGLLSSCGGGTAYTSGLERFSAEDGLGNQVVELPGGDKLSVGSPDRQDVVVQRYDAAAGGWSEPQRIHRETELWTHHLDVHQLGGTVAVAADYWVEEQVPDTGPELTVGAVCRETCTAAVRADEQLSEVTLADGGDYAAFPVAERRVAVWDGGDDWEEERLPDLGEGGAVRLAPDASFQGLTGESAAEGCVYTLHTTEPRGLDFTEQVSTAPVPGDDWCAPSFHGTEEDPTTEVAVWVEAISGTIDLRVDEGGWRVEETPAGHESVADTGGRSTLAPIFVTGADGAEAVLYSPDTHAIWTRTRYPSQPQWSKPRLVLTTPADVACRTGRIEAAADGYELYARLDCYEGDRGPGGPPDITLAAISVNSGSVWRAGLVEGAGRYALGHDDATLVAGTPGVLLPLGGGDAVPVSLPFPAPDVDPLVQDGEWLLRVAPRLEDGACRATMWGAGSPQDETWVAGASFDVPLLAGACPRLLAAELHSSVADDVVVRAEGVAGWRVHGERVRGRWQVSAR